MSANEHRDQYTPDKVHRLLALHKTRLEKQASVWRMLNAAYLTRFWEYVGSMSSDVRWARWNINGTEVEVNKLWRRVMTYKAALFRKTSRIECGPDPIAKRGDPTIGGAVSNAMWSDESSAEQMDRAVELSILFPGSAFKVGVDEGRAPAVRRVWTRVIPWWELVLDSDVSDGKDERFRGHRYWAPKQMIEEKYDLKDLKGAARQDFLFQDNAQVDSRDRSATESGDDGEFVEVLEFCNLTDWVEGKGGKYKGRLEIYILGQDDKYRDPIRVTPLPFADANGVGIPHIEPLIFNHEPSFPLRGVSPCARQLPQLRETNVYRTKLAELMRRNARKYVMRKGSLPDDQVDKLTNANDSEVAQVEDESVDITKVLIPIAQLAPPVEFWRWMDLVAQDDEQAWGQSGPATGQSSDKGKTAYANQIEQFWTESEIGYHGQALTAAVKRLARLRLRAVVHAMQSVGDAAGGTATQGPDVELAPIGVTDGDGMDGTAAEAVVADNKGAQGPAVAEAEAPAVAAETGEGDPTRVGAIVVAEFTVKDNDGNEHRVTVEALDADFVIKFVDGARTPMADAALLQFLSTQGETYMGWFAIVMKGGPMAVVARAWMAEMAVVAQLPPSLHVEALERKAAEEGKAPELPKPEAPPPGVEEGPPAPEQVAPQERGDPLVMMLGEIARGLSDAAKGAPEIAEIVNASLAEVQNAAAAVDSGDDMAIVEALGAALDALEPLNGRIPPGVEPALAHAVEIMDQVQRALMKRAAAQGQTPEGAPNAPV